MMKVQTELERISPDMAAPDGKLVASISTYGHGGANGHIVVEYFNVIGQTRVAADTVYEPKTTIPPLCLFTIGTLTSVGGKPLSPPTSRTSPRQEPCVHSHMSLFDRLAPPHTAPSPSALPSIPVSSGLKPLSLPLNQGYAWSSLGRVLNTSSFVTNSPRLSPLSSMLSRQTMRS